MDTEVWIRNPRTFHRQALEGGFYDWIWDKGYCVRNSVDPLAMMNIALRGRPWRCIEVRYEFAEGYSPDGKVGVWPVWNPGDHSLDHLLTLVKRPWGSGGRLPKNLEHLKPKPEQEHRIILAGLPNVRLATSKKLYVELSKIQQEYPAVILHVHALYSWRVLFGLHFRSVDVDPYQDAVTQNVTLPNGRRIAWQEAVEYLQWMRVLGFTPLQLKKREARLLYTMLSARWASEHFKESVAFRTRGFEAIDPDMPLKRKFSTVAKKLRLPPAHEGDKFLCDVCSLQRICPHYREGSVCAVMGTDGAALGQMFGSRDSGQIIEGLGELLKIESERLASALEVEEVKGEIHPETTKMINTLFDRGKRLAELVDPSLTLRGNLPSPTKIGVQIISNASPATLMAAIAGKLEELGVPREDITPELVRKFMKIDDEEKRVVAIEAHVIDRSIAEEDDDE